MKLLSVSNARSVWLGPISDLNPRGLNLFPIIIPLLRETYKFIKCPSLEDTLNAKDGLKFEKGEFAGDQDYPVGIDLTIYNDGLIADACSDTVHTDAFLKDMLKRFNDTFGISSYDEVLVRKAYLSEIYFTTDKSLESANPQFKLISEFLSDNVEQNKQFEMGRISFFPDQTSKSNPAPFSVERALNVPFSENRYYSIAPLQTQKHIVLIEKLEAMLSDK